MEKKKKRTYEAGMPGVLLPLELAKRTGVEPLPGLRRTRLVATGENRLTPPVEN